MIIYISNKVEYSRYDRFIIFKIGIIKVIRNRVNHKFTFKDTMQINTLQGCVYNWDFDKMAFMVDLRTDIRTKKMVNIIFSKISCV